MLNVVNLPQFLQLLHSAVSLGLLKALYTSPPGRPIRNRVLSIESPTLEPLRYYRSPRVPLAPPSRSPRVPLAPPRIPLATPRVPLASPSRPPRAPLAFPSRPPRVPLASPRAPSRPPRAPSCPPRVPLADLPLFRRNCPGLCFVM